MCFSSIVGLERHIPRCFKNSHIEDRVWEIFKRFFFFQTIDAGVVVVVVGLTHARKSCLHGATPSLVNVYFSPVPITTRESHLYFFHLGSLTSTPLPLPFSGFYYIFQSPPPATFNSVWLSPSPPPPSFYLSNSIEFSFSCCCCCCWHSIRFPPFFFLEHWGLVGSSFFRVPVRLAAAALVFRVTCCCITDSVKVITNKKPHRGGNLLKTKPLEPRRFELLSLHFLPGDCEE